MMENLFGQLYLDLSTHLKTAVPEIRWIDQDFGQLEHFEYRPEVSFPAALVDFPSTTYTAMSELAQLGELTVQIRLGFAPFSQAYQAAPMDVKEKALAYFDVEQKVMEALHGWHNAFTQPFIRVSAVTEQRDNDQAGLRVRVLTFTTMYEDLSNLTVYQKTPAIPEIEQEEL